MTPALTTKGRARLTIYGDRQNPPLGSLFSKSHAVFVEMPAFQKT
jgi:hypothetical protein